MSQYEAVRIWVTALNSSLAWRSPGNTAGTGNTLCQLDQIRLALSLSPRQVAETIGGDYRGRALDKAKQVVEAAEKDPEAFLPLVEEMDRTAKVGPAYQRVKKAERRSRKPGTRDSHRSNEDAQIAPLS